MRTFGTVVIPMQQSLKHDDRERLPPASNLSLLREYITIEDGVQRWGGGGMGAPNPDT